MQTHDYRTKDGKKLFRFLFVQDGNQVKTYIAKNDDYDLSQVDNLQEQVFYEVPAPTPCANQYEARKQAKAWAEAVWPRMNLSSSPVQEAMDNVVQTVEHGIQTMVQVGQAIAGVHTEEEASTVHHSSPSAGKVKEPRDHSRKKQKKRKPKLTMEFTRQAYESIAQSVGSRPAESGGILLGSRDNYLVTKFIFDTNGSTSRCGYDPDVNFINRCIKEEWEHNGLELLGFVHSHPPGVRRLSGDMGNGYGDIGYLKAIFRAIPALETFLVPIVFSSADIHGHEMEMIPYVAFKGQEANYQQAHLSIVQ